MTTGRHQQQQQRRPPSERRENKMKKKKSSKNDKNKSNDDDACCCCIISAITNNKERFEITVRMTVGAVLGYIFGIAYLPAIIPTASASQYKSLIGFVGPFLVTLYPTTLLFSIIAKAWQLIFVIVFALASATMLLSVIVVAAASSTSGANAGGALVGTYAVWVLWISGLRYDIKNGPLTPIIIIITLFIVLPQYGIITTQQSEDFDGFEYIKSLWTSSGLDNPVAVMQNNLIAWSWVVVILMVPSLVFPPYYRSTSRHLITQKLVPSILDDIVKLLHLRLETPTTPDNEFATEDGGQNGGDGVDDGDGGIPMGGGGEAVDDRVTADNDDNPTTTAAAGEDDDDTDADTFNDSDGGLALLPDYSTTNNVLELKLVERLSRSSIMLKRGDLAVMTAFEPRLLNCTPPECTWIVLKQLLLSVRTMIMYSFSATKLLDVKKKGTAVRAADTEAAGDDDNMALLASHHLEAIVILEECSRNLRRGTGDPNNNNNNMGVYGSGGVDQQQQSAGASEEEEEEELEACDNDDDNVEEGSVSSSSSNSSDFVDMRQYDPYRLKLKAKAVTNAVKEWNLVMMTRQQQQQQRCSPKGSSSDGKDESRCNVPPSTRHKKKRVRNYFDAVKMNVTPWFVSWFGFYKVLFVNVPYNILNPSTYKNLFDITQTNYLKVVWMIKFTLGATILLIMDIYWKEYAEFEVPTGGSDPNSVTIPYYPTWNLLAFTFATTQTTEGTVKKGSLRLIGTVLGGFSAWLALTACETTTNATATSYSYNPYGLVAWMTATTAVAVFLGTERGFQARMGLSADYGNGIQYFILTQAICAIYAYNGLGNENNLVANRIVANITGVLMAIVLSLIPPQVLAGSPQNGFAIWKLQEQGLIRIVRFVLDRTSGSYEDEASVKETLELVAEASQTISKQIELYTEADDWIKDGSKLSLLPVFRLDPTLKNSLGRLGITAARIDLLQNIARYFLARAEDRALFAPRMPLREELTSLLESVEHRQYLESFPAVSSTSSCSQENPPGGIPPFNELVQVIMSEMKANHDDLASVKYGLFSRTFTFAGWHEMYAGPRTVPLRSSSNNHSSIKIGDNSSSCVHSKSLGSGAVPDAEAVTP